MEPQSRRILAWSVVGLLVAGALAWSFRPRPLAVETAAVTAGAMRVTVSDEGQTAIRDVYQVSAPVAGQLLRVEKRAGDPVTGGETVVAALLPSAPSFLDERSRAQAEAAVKSAKAAETLAEAEVRSAQAELAYAEAELKRTQALAARSVVSAAELDRARLARDTKTAALATARAALEAKSYDLETARAQLVGPGNAPADTGARASISLIAPVSGQILRVLHENAAVVAAGTPIVEIGDPRDLEVVVDLISADAVKVRPGAEAAITDWGGERDLAARVRRIEPSGFTKTSALGIDEQRVNVRLDPLGDKADWAAIGDGFRVIARITVWSADKVTQLPVEAMFRRGDGWAVFAVRDGQAVLTPIAVGHANERAAEVVDGLAPGDVVIVHPSDRIADGTPVTAMTAP